MSSSVDPTQAQLTASFSRHRTHLWGLCYRITGDAAEADDLVQDTYARALERPPADMDRPLRPWLATVATRLSLDALRRRKKRAYRGPWLPTPIGDLAPLLEGVADPEQSDAEVRYGRLESLTLGFLVALEALTEQQRVALILRDVMGLSGPEAADVLETSPENVRVLLHRARKRLEAYEERSAGVGRDVDDRIRKALADLLAAVGSGDLDSVKSCLSPDVEVFTDSGGVYRAATKIVRGADAAAKLFLGLYKKNQPANMAVVSVNGRPGLWIETTGDGSRVAPAQVLQLEIDGDHRVAAVHSILQPDKVAAFRRGPRLTDAR